MKSQLRAIAVVAAMLGHSAMAADYPVYPNAPIYRPLPRAALFSWSGCYVGANLGAKWGNTSGTLVIAPGTPGENALIMQDQYVGSFIGGGQAGCNFQTGSLVLGIEGDIEGQHWDTSRTLGIQFGVDFVPIANLDILSRWEASARGRIGYAWDRILIYATGGVAWSNVRLSTVRLPPLLAVGSFSDNQTLVGGTIGGGIEHAFLASNWSFALEGRYTTYGTHAFNSGQFGFFGVVPMTTNLKLYTVEGLLKMNYRFGGPVITGY